MMNQKNEPEQINHNNVTNVSEPEYTALLSELSKECLRLETENAELAKHLKGQPSAADQKQSKADEAAFLKVIHDNQARRRQ